MPQQPMGVWPRRTHACVYVWWRAPQPGKIVRMTTPFQKGLHPVRLSLEFREKFKQVGIASDAGSPRFHFDRHMSSEICRLYLHVHIKIYLQDWCLHVCVLKNEHRMDTTHSPTMLTRSHAAHSSKTDTSHPDSECRQHYRRNSMPARRLPHACTPKHTARRCG